MAKKENSLFNALINAREDTPTQEDQSVLLKAPEKEQEVQGPSGKKQEGQKGHQRKTGERVEAPEKEQEVQGASGKEQEAWRPLEKESRKPAK